MLIYQRYIIKQIFIPFAMSCFVITSVVWITQVLRFVYLLNHGIGLTDFLAIIILIIPSTLFTILPIIALFAIVYSYNHLSTNKQLLVLQNAGLSNFQLTFPSLLFVSLVLIIAYYISLYLMPITYAKLRKELNIIKNVYNANIINEKEFTKISKDIVIYVATKSSANEFKGIVLFDNRNAEQQIIVFAKTGCFEIVNNNVILQLKHGLRQAYDINSNLTKLYFMDLAVEFYQPSKDLEDLYKRNVREYFIAELFTPNKKLSKNKQNRLIVEGHQRIIWPSYVIMLALFALSILLKTNHSGRGNFSRVLLIITLVIAIIYLHFYYQNLAINNIRFIYFSYINLFVIILCSYYLLLNKKT